MYEQRFGLERKPFETTPTGADVFVGPQTAKTVEAFRKSLASRDAVVIVSGQVGTGKTTLVHRAIDSLGTKYKTIRVGRMRMESSEVLESLLIVLGVKDRPSSSMQRFAALRSTLKAHEDRGVRIFIVVEDALRSGAESLAELEALTAADAGESDGANIVVMGDETLPKFMTDPQLAQMQQRVRQRHTISPLTVSELKGYLVHSFRCAGGNFEHIFDERAAALLHHLSGGIPRLTNNLVDASMSAAANNELVKIPAAFIAKVAEENFALSADGFDFSIPEAAVPGSQDIPAASAASDAIETPHMEPVEDTKSADAGNVPADDGADDIPHLIQDTIAGLEVLSPDTSTPADQAASDVVDEEVSASPVGDESLVEPYAEWQPPNKNIPELTPVAEPAEEDIPELTASARIDHDDLSDFDAAALEKEYAVQPDSPSATGSGQLTEIVPELELEFGDADIADDPTVIASPEWQGNPTYAEFLPDLDALDQAMAVTSGEPVETSSTGRVYTYSLDEIKAQDCDIDLGQSGTGDLAATVNLSMDSDDAAGPQSQGPGVELGQVAAGIGSTPTLEQVDDKLAETLFGTEFSFVAEQAIGNIPPNDADIGALALVPDEPPKGRPAVIPVAREVSVKCLESANDAQSVDPGAQKKDVLHTLDTDASPLLRRPKARAPVPPPVTSVKEAADQSVPKSIEDQMDFSIPSSVDALEATADDADDAPDDQAKTGFFKRLRFRRS